MKVMVRWALERRVGSGMSTIVGVIKVWEVLCSAGGESVRCYPGAIRRGMEI